MPTPKKPVSLIEGHITKEAREHREQAEKANLSGEPLQERPEVKNNPVAHREFLRIKKLLKAIGKDDDLFRDTVNMQCELLAECAEYAKLQNELIKQSEQKEYNKDLAAITKSIINIDKLLMAKRTMRTRLAIENVMTVKAGIQSIPEKEIPEPKSEMALLLERGRPR